MVCWPRGTLRLKRPSPSVSAKTDWCSTYTSTPLIGFSVRSSMTMPATAVWANTSVVTQTVTKRRPSTRLAVTPQGVSTSDAILKSQIPTPKSSGRRVACNAHFDSRRELRIASNEGRTLSRRGQDRDGAERRTASSADLHGQRNHVRAGDGQTLERGDVLESGHVALVEDTVRLKQGRLPVVDAGRVDADRTNASVGDEPSRGVGMQSGEMQELRAFFPPCRRSQILRRVRPSFREAGPYEHDRIGGHHAVLALEAREVLGRHLIVRVRLALRGHIDDEGAAKQTAQRNRVNRRMSLREMNRRVDVRAAVLGREQAVRGVVVARWRHTVSILAKTEAFGSWPVDRLCVVGVREIDELALRKRRRLGSAAGRGHKHERQSNRARFHPSDSTRWHSV